MKICPKCGYQDEPYWRPAKMRNPSGDIDIARIDDLDLFQTELAARIRGNLGYVITDGCFSYLLTKRSVWVKRVAVQVYKSCGIGIFKPPIETSGHSRLVNRLSDTKKSREREQHSKEALEQ